MNKFKAFLHTAAIILLVILAVILFIKICIKTAFVEFK